MKITLIKPKVGRQRFVPFTEKGVFEPLQMAVIAALTPPDVEIVMYDDRFEKVPFDDPTDLVALTVETFNAKRAYDIASQYRKRGVPVIMGGMHPTLAPDEVREHADSIYTGDAEFLWESVVHDAAERRLKKRYDAPCGLPEEKVLPRREIFSGKKYIPVSLVQFNRGCQFGCTFCAVAGFYKKHAYTKCIDHIIEEVASAPHKLILFADDNLMANRKLAKDLFRELIPLKKWWVSQASIEITRDSELLDLMKQSGGKGVLIGLESIKPATLRAMRKDPNLSDFNLYETPLRILREHGLLLWGTFVFGYDDDSVDDIWRTLDFVMRNKFSAADFNVLIPFPGTPIYADLAGENRLMYDGKWWLHSDYRYGHAAYIPKRMTPDELTEACIGVRRKFSSFGATLYRSMDPHVNLRSWSNLGIFILCNILHRNDVVKGHGMILGHSD
jgi:radical SAM superfamily enzyme YgiQ (UPF0313 family)